MPKFTDTIEIQVKAGDGGPGAVSTAVTSRLATVLGGSGHVNRIWGDTRYETAKAFAVWACDLTGPGTVGNGFVGTPSEPDALLRFSWDNVGIASGQNFPDALAGGALQGGDRGFVLLTSGTDLEAGVADILSDNKDSIYEIRYLGGTGVIEADVRTDAEAQLW